MTPPWLVVFTADSWSQLERHLGIYGGIVDDDVAEELVDCDHLFLAADTMQARLVFNAVVHQ